MILDFKEIPEANKNSGLQDSFELFSRDFLEVLGFKIIRQPDRGADGKKDIVVREIRTGLVGETNVDWLVSCKHFAHSGKSVSDKDEPDILDRVKAHNCRGFLGVYSTLPSSGLSNKLEGLKDKIEYNVFDKERIEKKLLENANGLKLSRRYFVKSIEKFERENPKPAKIFDEQAIINCDYCKKNLLTNREGIFDFFVEFIEDENTSHKLKKSKIKEVVFCCKGKCTDHLEYYYKKNFGYYDFGWQDIYDFTIPTLYLKYLLAFINAILEDKYEENVITKMKSLFINTFPYIARELTDDERQYVKMIFSIPDGY